MSEDKKLEDLGDFIEMLTDEQIPSAWSHYTDADWKAKSLACIASDGSGHGAVLWTKGPHVEYEIHEVGLTDLGDLGLDGAPAGVSVWEGRYVAVGSGDDCETEPRGTFRKPTDEEWAAIKDGRDPWWKPEEKPTEAPCARCLLSPEPGSPFCIEHQPRALAAKAREGGT